MTTNANPNQPNGMPFKRTEVEEYNHIIWRENDERNEPASASQPIGELLDQFPGSQRDWAFDYKLKSQVEESRFVSRPMTGRNIPVDPSDED